MPKIKILKLQIYHFTDHGTIIKTINAASADDSEKVSSVVIEELDVLPKSEPIRNLKIVRTMQYGKKSRKILIKNQIQMILNVLMTFCRSTKRW